MTNFKIKKKITTDLYSKNQYIETLLLKVQKIYNIF